MGLCIDVEECRNTWNIFERGFQGFEKGTEVFVNLYMENTGKRRFRGSFSSLECVTCDRQENFVV